MANPISTMINSASGRRASKRDGKLLERQYASLSTPYERDELAIILGRYRDDRTQEMRETLGRQATRLF